jgi:thymidylate kinase
MTAHDTAERVGPLAALRDAGVAFEPRKETANDPWSSRGELDIAVRRRDLPQIERVLRDAGLYRLRANGHPGHRFFIGQRGGVWVKVDAKFPASRTARLLAPLTRPLPVGIRRRGPVIAVLGPDGAGKGTVIARLLERIPVGVTAIYLGSGASGGLTPPTAPTVPRVGPGPLREIAGVLRKTLRVWPKLVRGSLEARRGHVVLFDRHPLEALAIKPERSAPAAALERLLAAHLTPWPDAIIVLDAHADLLYRRTREHPPEVLEAWRRAYAETFVPFGAVVVSTNGPRGPAVDTASNIVWGALRRRARWDA